MDLRDATVVAGVLRDAAAAHRGQAGRSGMRVALPESVKRLVVAGDLHDHSPGLRAAMDAADLDGRDDSHLVLQELIHPPELTAGLDLSIRTLARVAGLKVQHPDRLTVLLSNHELAQAQGERIMKSGRPACEAFTQGVESLYGEDARDVMTAMRDYVRALPLAVQTSGGTLMAHSLPSGSKLTGFDPAVLDREASDEDYRRGGSAHAMVWGRKQDAEVVRRLAGAWGVGSFLLAHQHADGGAAALTGRAMILNSDGEPPRVAVLDPARRYDDAKALLGTVRPRVR